MISTTEPTRLTKKHMRAHVFFITKNNVQIVNKLRTTWKTGTWKIGKLRILEHGKIDHNGHGKLNNGKIETHWKMEHCKN